MSTILLGRRALWYLLSLSAPVVCQTQITPRLFQWKFADGDISTTLPTCSPIAIIVESFDITTNATNGIPPYYMISYPVGGFPATELIGTDENNLSWTITQPPNSQLLLSVVDSAGNPGGSPAQLITVNPGQTTECVTTPLNTPAFTVTANVTGNIETCAPWGITISGGSPPYILSLVETDSPVVTNVSVPFGNNQFTFINRATAGGQLIAAVSDFTGRWASGTPLVHPVGSSDTDCTGLVSSSGNATVIQQQDAQANAAAAAAAHHHEVVVAVVVAVVLLLLGAAGYGVLRRIVKRNQRIRDEFAATLPTQFPTSPQLQETQQTSYFKSKRRDIEAPPYREFEPISDARPSGSQPMGKTSPVSAASNRPTLSRLQITSPPSNIREKPARYLDSSTATAPGSSAVPSSTLNPSSNGRSARNSHFAAFPVTSVRKNTTVGMSRSASAFASGSASTAGAGVSRNATVATSSVSVSRSAPTNVNPFIIEEEDESALNESVLGKHLHYYSQDSNGLTDPLDGLPPRYRSIKYKGGRRQRDGSA